MSSLIGIIHKELERLKAPFCHIPPEFSDFKPAHREVIAAALYHIALLCAKGIYRFVSLKYCIFAVDEKEDTRRVVKFPYKVQFVHKNAHNALLLHFPFVIAKGGYRQVKVSFDCSVGQFYVRKAISLEELNIFQALKKCPCAHQPAYIRKRSIRLIDLEIGSNGGIKANFIAKKLKIQSIETKSDGDLATLLLKHEIGNPGHFCKLLLQGILEIHATSISLEDLSIQQNGKVPVIHFDIKPQNILLFKKPIAHLRFTDFGIAKHGYMRNVGTALYVPPECDKTDLEHREIKERELLGKAQDYWGIGLIIAMILFGMHRKYQDHDNLYPNIQALVNFQQHRDQNILKEELKIELEKKILNLPLSLTNYGILLKDLFSIDPKSRYERGLKQIRRSLRSSMPDSLHPHAMIEESFSRDIKSTPSSPIMLRKLIAGTSKSAPSSPITSRKLIPGPSSIKTLKIRSLND